MEWSKLTSRGGSKVGLEEPAPGAWCPACRASPQSPLARSSSAVVTCSATSRRSLLSAKAVTRRLPRTSTFSPEIPCSLRPWAASSLSIRRIRWYCARSKFLAPCLRVRMELYSLAGLTVSPLPEELDGGSLPRLQPWEKHRWPPGMGRPQCRGSCRGSICPSRPLCPL